MTIENNFNRMHKTTSKGLFFSAFTLSMQPDLQKNMWDLKSY